MTRIKPLMISIILLILIQFCFPLHADAAPKYPKGTMIANLLIEGETLEDARLALTDEIVYWNSEEDLIIESDFETYHVPRSVVTFDIDATLHKMNEQTKRKLTNFFMRPKNVHLPFVVHINEEDEALKALKELDHIDYDATIQELKEFASELRNEPIPLIYVNEDHVPFETIKQIEKEIPDNMSTAVITYIAEELEDYIILPEESFSLLDSVTFPGELNNSKQELSFAASMLYELFLHTNVEIISKHIPIHVPTYTKAGLAVEVDREQDKDFVIYNDDSTPLKLSTHLKDGQLAISLETISMDNSYKYEITKIEEIEPRTIYRYSNKLDPGEQEVIQTGKKGEKVTVERFIYKNKVFLDKEIISEEVFLPVPKIVVISAQEAIEYEENMEETEAIGLDDMITDELDERTDEMRQTIDELDEKISDDENMDEDDLLDSTLGLLDFLEQYETFKQKIEEFDERLELIEKSLSTSMNEDYQNLIEYQKEIEKSIEELNRHYEQILDLILNGEKGV